MSTKIEAALIAESRNHPGVYGDWWAGLEAMAPDVARVVDDAVGYDALVAERDRLRKALQEIAAGAALAGFELIVPQEDHDA
jgi:hypothetical protein